MTASGPAGSQHNVRRPVGERAHGQLRREIERLRAPRGQAQAAPLPLVPPLWRGALALLAGGRGRRRSRWRRRRPSAVAADPNLAPAHASSGTTSGTRFLHHRRPRAGRYRAEADRAAIPTVTWPWPTPTPATAGTAARRGRCSTADRGIALDIQRPTSPARRRGRRLGRAAAAATCTGGSRHAAGELFAVSPSWAACCDEEACTRRLAATWPPRRAEASAPRGEAVGEAAGTPSRQSRTTPSAAISAQGRRGALTPPPRPSRAPRPWRWPWRPRPPHVINAAAAERDGRDAPRTVHACRGSPCRRRRSSPPPARRHRALDDVVQDRRSTTPSAACGAT